MPTLLRPPFTTGGWGSPKLDLAGCVLYAPLWRPDMVARGGGIKNGTGTLDVSPQNLAVGANTITATGAGTFIITVPQAGTCASGTATITGSPVTLNAGVATTVTTGVTTGNFTVTTSNIIRSKDSIGHLCTITGATWGYQGRDFDGSDDYIDGGLASALNFTTESFTIQAWCYIHTISAPNFHYIVIRGLSITDGWAFKAETPGYLEFNTWQAGAGQESYSSSTAISLNTWLFLEATRNGASCRLYKNLVDITSAAATHINPLTSARTLKIGRDDSAARYLDGVIGEIFAYNRLLSTAERTNNYLATKWRYSG